MLAIGFVPPTEVAAQLAARVKARRLEMNITQVGMAERAGLKYATYRRFERTGEISLRGLLQVAFAMDMLSDFDVLFARRQYESLDELLIEQQHMGRKRGKRK